MTIWFTSDTHYGHPGIILYAQRPFTDVTEMNEEMITRWNAVVRPTDTIYHLGDFALCRPDDAIALVRRLNGRKHLIFGNHDQRLRTNATFLESWLWARDLTQLKVNDQKITLCHYAMRTWASAHHGAWQLYGHSHGTLSEDPRARSTDVGVDCWNYAPVAFETLQALMLLREWSPIDHHGA